MPVAYEDYWAASIQAAIALIAGSTTFAALVSPTTPADRIVEIDGGREDETTPTITASTGATFAHTVPLWAHVCPDAPEFQGLWQAPSASVTRDGSIPVACYFRPTGITLRHELLRYALSKTGLIAREIENQAGGAGRWRRIVCNLGGMQFLDASGHGRGTIRTAFTIQFGDLP